MHTRLSEVFLVKMESKTPRKLAYSCVLTAVLEEQIKVKLVMEDRKFTGA